MENIVDSGKKVRNANARMAGAVSIAMVSAFSPAAPFAFSYWTTVCKTDDACVGFPLRGQPTDSDDADRVGNMTCYKGGETVFNNHQFCDVTSAYWLVV